MDNGLLIIWRGLVAVIKDFHLVVNMKSVRLKSVNRSIRLETHKTVFRSPGQR